MGSFPGNCEIVESNEELNSLQHTEGVRQPRVHDKEGKHPVLKQVSNNTLEDEINKLFEAVNLKTSSRGLNSSDQVSTSPSRKNALKKPMRMGMSPPPGIGFSESVSLKQALRGLCISQASEMAAMKRSIPGSPRISEASKITSLYRSVVVEASEAGKLPAEGKEGKVEISLLPEESTSKYCVKMPKLIQEIRMESNDSTHSSPRFAIVSTDSTSKQHEVLPTSTEVGNHQPSTEPAQDERHNSACCIPCHETGDNTSELYKNISVPVKQANNLHKNVSVASSKFANKEATKPKQKGRSQTVSSSSSTIKSTKISKSMRNVPRVKPVIRNKTLVKKKSKQDSVSASGTSITKNEATGDLVPVTSQLICHRCKCALKDAGQESGKDFSVPLAVIARTEVSSSNGNYAASKPGSTLSNCDTSGPVMVKAIKNSKSKEKGEFSHSSKSSIGDYSSSTSFSEESNVSGSSFGNRPHMSKDLRWEAIHHALKQHGFLGLEHFSLLKKLGCGDIGTVYLAKLIGTNCLFAIKVMDNDFLARRKKLPRAQTEREILRMLDHPFLPTLYTQFTSDNLSCLVMEYCPGGDLHVLRQKQPGRYFPEQAARFYVAEVLLALEYLHVLGIVYRDLKPENIMVREDGHIMLTDFDLSLRCSVNPTLLKSSSFAMEPARVSGPCRGSSCIDPFCMEPSCQVSCFSPRLLPTAAKTRRRKADLAAQIRSLPQLVAEPTDARSNSFVGTHEYLAPEIIKGEGHGSAVDWWTFGIFLYELLYGKTPFKGSGNEETLANVVFESLEFPDSPIVSFQARDLIRGLLVKEPENRLGSAKGTAEIKQHPFFHGLNWALIRCTIPPQLPEFCDIGVLNLPSQEKGRKYLEYKNTGEHLEFELF